MQYEIDYIPVGTGEKGGDAICFRYGDFRSRATQKVVIIDGGTKDSGRALVEHVKKYYGTTRVDLVVASHLHNDHISGITEVLENLVVDKLAIHCPWDYTKSIQKMTIGHHSLNDIEKKLEKSLATLSDVVDLAEKRKVKIIQPFSGEQILDGIYVLNPSKDYYQQLLANFGITPDVKEKHKIEEIFTTIKEAIIWIAETLDIETLSDDYQDTTPENNSSLVLLFVADNKKILFTGDAGKDALMRAIDFAESCGISLKDLDFFDVPHHGSKRNLGPTILNRLMPQLTFISCPPKGDPKHPSRKVVNALIRRGRQKPGSTRRGNLICHHSINVPQRYGWVSLTPEEFFKQVEE